MKSVWADEPVHTGVAAALVRDHIDTDALIASRDITTPGRTGLGARLLAVWRFDPATGEPLPDFVLNRAPWHEATILLAGRNFGCGSSREMAVWALMEFGIRAVVANSFGEIFRANALRNGLAPIEVAPQALAEMAVHASAARPLTVDLPACCIRVGPHAVAASPTAVDAPGPWPFAMDPRALDALLKAQDPIEQALAYDAQLQAHEQRDRAQRPWVWNFPPIDRSST